MDTLLAIYMPAVIYTAATGGNCRSRGVVVVSLVCSLKCTQINCNYSVRYVWIVLNGSGSINKHHHVWPARPTVLCDRQCGWLAKAPMESGIFQAQGVRVFFFISLCLRACGNLLSSQCVCWVSLVSWQKLVKGSVINYRQTG